MKKLIITAAITGGEQSKQDMPNLPVTPDEIALEAYNCYKAGASMVHIHARDENFNPTQKKEVYDKIIKKIREKCPILIQVSTGGSVWMTPEERLEPIYLKPDMATLTTGTVNFGEDVFQNSLKNIEKFAEEMMKLNIKPELEIFDLGHIHTALYLLKKGFIKRPLHFDFVLGVLGACNGELQNLMYMISQIPEDSTWTVAGIGRYELFLAVNAITLGGNVRVGLEDNIYYKKGVKAKSNVELVERIVRISKELDREIATPFEAKEILGLY
jgi:3-keto-5-aminohexanoate cleavage enzyme